MSKNNFKGTYAFKTDPGKVRLTNEDRVNVVTNHKGQVFMIICDGIGGQSKGDYASKLAIDYLTDAFLEINPNLPTLFKMSLLKKKIKEVNNIIFEEASTKEDCKNMGTTLVCALISRRHLIVANAGDSRAYLIDQNNIKRITEDQTYVDFLYRTGKVKESELNTHPDRHVLMNALGIFPSLSIDMKLIKFNGESILLCSDGLYNNVSDKEIFAVCKTDDRVEQKVNELIKESNANGGSDNIAAALWECIHD